MKIQLDGEADMQEHQCRHCGSSEVLVKEIEVRHINSVTMVLNAKEVLKELECKHCGWIVALPQEAISVSGNKTFQPAL